MKTSKTGQKKTGVFLVGAGVIALLCAALLWFMEARDIEMEFEPSQTPLAQYADSSDYIYIPGFESMTIPSGKTRVPSVIYNPEKNQCYFEVSISLSETNEKIYQSKLISPGQVLYEIELIRELDEGQYNAVLHYTTYALDDLKNLNGANVPVMLIVD